MPSLHIARWLAENGWASRLVVIAFGAFVVGDNVNAVLGSRLRGAPVFEQAAEGEASRAPQRVEVTPSFRAMAERNLLAARRAPVEPRPPDVSSPCRLGAQVRGTLVAANRPQWSMALINIGNAGTQVFTINEGSNRLDDDAVLVAIHSREVVIRRGDRLEHCGEDSVPVPSPSALPRIGAMMQIDDGITQISETEYRVGLRRGPGVR